MRPSSVPPTEAGRGGLSTRRIVRAAILVSVVATVALLCWRIPVALRARAARRAFAARDYAAAEEAIARWLRLSPGAAEAELLRARIAIARDRPKEAFADLQKAESRLGAESPKCRLVRAILAVKVGQFDAAEPILAAAFTAPHEPDPQLDHALARLYLERFDLPRAMTVLERWFADAPDDAIPYLWRTEIENRLTHHMPLVIDDYREALKRDPKLARARLGLAEALRKDYRNAEAAKEYAAYLALEPDDPIGHLGAGRNALALGDEAEALRQFDLVAARDPGNAQVDAERATIALKHGRDEEALRLLDRAVKRDPFDVQIRYNRGLVLSRLGRAEESKAEHAAANRLRTEQERLTKVRARLIRSPHDAELQAETARWMFEHGQEAEGVRWAEKILRENPGHPAATRLLADYYEAHGNAGLANFYRLQQGAGPPGRP
jgi:predicted Zn-dependent protease